MNRAPGYYWVKETNMCPDWEVCRYDGLTWCVCGVDMEWEDEGFEEGFEVYPYRIETPPQKYSQGVCRGYQGRMALLEGRFVCLIQQVLPKGYIVVRYKNPPFYVSFDALHVYGNLEAPLCHHPVDDSDWSLCAGKAKSQICRCCEFYLDYDSDFTVSMEG